MYLPLGRQGVRLVAQVPGHNKKALRRGGNIIAPFCLPVNRYLKICPTTAHFFAAGSRSVPGGGRAPALPADLAAVVPGGGHNGFGRRSIFYFSRFSAPIPPTPFPAGRGGIKVFFMQGASPLASPRLNPRGTYRACQAGARSGALPLAGRGWVAFRYPAGGVAVWVARLPFTLALFLPPSPRPPSQREGGDFKVILCKGLRPLHPQG